MPSPTLLRRPRPEALGALLGFFVAFYAVYAATALAGDHFTRRYQWFFEWETSIPAVPCMALVYASLNLVVIPVAGTFTTLGRLRPLVLTIAVELVVATLCFWLFPLQDGYPPVAPAGWDGQVMMQVKSLAIRHNYFPSLHVTLATTAALCLAHQWRGRYSGYLYSWAALVALSTLLIHEHHLIDIAGGLALSYTGYRLVYLKSFESKSRSAASLNDC